MKNHETVDATEPMRRKRINLRNLQSLSEQAYEAIKNAIMDSRLKPGERLFEYQIANELGVSRVPVREAFQKLENEGFIVAKRRREFRVATLSKKQIEDILDVRCILETYAAKRSWQRISISDFKAMERCIDKSEAAISRNDMLRFRAEFVEFHKIMHKIYGNEKLLELYVLLSDLAFPYSGAKATTIEEKFAIIEDHRRIVTAIRSKDEAAIVEAIKLFHSKATDRIITRLMRK